MDSSATSITVQASVAIRPTNPSFNWADEVIEELENCKLEDNPEPESSTTPTQTTTPEKEQSSEQTSSETPEIDLCLLDFSLSKEIATQESPKYEEVVNITQVNPYYTTPEIRDGIYARFTAQPPSLYHAGPAYTEEFLNLLYKDHLNDDHFNPYRQMFLPKRIHKYNSLDKIPTYARPESKIKRTWESKKPSNLNNVLSYGDST